MIKTHIVNIHGTSKQLQIEMKSTKVQNPRRILRYYADTRERKLGTPRMHCRPYAAAAGCVFGQNYTALTVLSPITLSSFFLSHFFVFFLFVFTPFGGVYVNNSNTHAHYF